MLCSTAHRSIPRNTKLIFEKEGVYLNTNTNGRNQDTSIPGFIRIIKRDGEPALEWCQLKWCPLNNALYTKENGEGGEEATDFD